MNEHEKLGQKQVSKVTLQFVWGHFSRKQTVLSISLMALRIHMFSYAACGVPEGYSAQYINGFVEELVVNDDPEYQWIDKIRTPRASNEARQTLFLKLSGAIQRKIGLKALELGGNAVIGCVSRNSY